MTQNVEQIMSRQPVVIHVDHPLAEAANRMSEADIGALFVVDGDELVGVVTDRDLVVRGLCQGADPNSTTVIEMMTRHVVSCGTSCSIDDAAGLMAEQQIRRLAIVNRNRELVGVLSLADLARAAGLDGSLVERVLRRVSVPACTAKTPGPEDPAGRARKSPAGTVHVYAPKPRIRRMLPPTVTE